MATGGKHGENEGHAGAYSARRRMAQRTTPEWADGLKQLYDAVVEEQLPDQFLDLLAKLDEQDTAPSGRTDTPGSSDAR